MNTGDSKVNVVGVDASSEMNTSAGSLTTLDNGTITCVGVPFTTVLISRDTGISASLLWKNRSTLLRYTPPSNPDSSTRKVCASGSMNLVCVLEDVLTRVLSSLISSEVTCAFLTEMIVSC